MNRCLAAATLAFSLALGDGAVGQPIQAPTVREADFVLRDFRFQSGERLPELRLHYRTLGTPVRDTSGRVINAVLILHGTGGSGAQFLRPQFSGELFGPGQLLDVRKYFIILPDDIGHGKSSKPSEGLRAHFPRYDYDDMVRVEHALVTDGLGVAKLRLVMGTSMGCMHSFMWAEMWPGAERAVMPLACLPVAIAGRNRLWRRMIIDDIEHDPTWNGGEYKSEPRNGLGAAADILTIAGSAPRRDAEDPGDAGGRRPLYRWPACAVSGGPRRQRSHLSGRFLARLRSVRRFGVDPGAGHVGQFGGRLY